MLPLSELRKKLPQKKNGKSAQSGEPTHSYIASRTSPRYPLADLVSRVPGSFFDDYLS